MKSYLVPITLAIAALGGILLGVYLIVATRAPSCTGIRPLTADAPFLVAYRGAPDHRPSPTWIGFSMSGVFENTVASFLRARARGLSAVDLGLRLTKDGHLIAMEDAEVLRTTGAEGVVASMTLAELAELDAGGGAQIPTLDEVFAALGDSVQYHLRLPEGDAGEEVGEVLGARLASEPLAAQVMVAAPDPSSLAEVRRAAPSTPVLLIPAEPRSPWSVVDQGAWACIVGVDVHIELELV